MSTLCMQCINCGSTVELKYNYRTKKHSIKCYGCDTETYAYKTKAEALASWRLNWNQEYNNNRSKVIYKTGANK